MKSFIFLSDFDGTISVKDFYLKFAKGYLHKLDSHCLNEVKAGRMSSFEYLNEILLNLNLSKEELQKEIQSLEIDPFVVPLVNKLSQFGGEFKVLSAGSDYYIRPILDNLGLIDTQIFSNGGSFSGTGIEMSYPENREFYHEFYGIDKKIVAQQFRSNYQTMIYAGDGSSDFEAAKLSDIRFAKRSLARRLTEADIPFIQFETFEDIENYLNIHFFEKSTCQC
jgi:2-hydroxy-3-keto-5-methylthiopentenyl-1-phosphate phosphatase